MIYILSIIGHNNNNNNNHNSEVGTSSSHQFVINNNINNNNNGNNTNTNEQATQMEIGTNEFQDGGQQHEDNNRLAGSSAYRHTTIPLMLRITHDADDNVEVQRSNSLLTTANSMCFLEITIILLLYNSNNIKK